MNNTYDIAIIGAGMVGLSFANCLADLDLSIAIIDSRPISDDIQLVDYPMRVSAISKRSQKLFEKIACWQTMGELRVSPYRRMQVWDSEGNGEIKFDSADIGEPALGHIIENDVILYALQKRLRSFDNIHFKAPETLTALKKNNDGITLQTESGTLQATLVVGADGANSWVRQQCHIQLKQRAYEHKAIVATVVTEKPHQLTAWQRFLPTGPLAFLPLQDKHQCSIVWSCTPDKADYLVSLEEDSFKQALAHAFDHRLGNIEQTGRRVSFPLFMRHAKTYTQPNIALIGDAAHTIHPLAGQGVNLGIADAYELSRVIKTALAKQQNYAKHIILRRYERARKGENKLMIAAMSGFKQLFGSELAPVKMLRNMGLNVTNSCSPLKNIIIKQAMGGD